MNFNRLAAVIPKDSRAEALHHTSEISSSKHFQVKYCNYELKILSCAFTMKCERSMESHSQVLTCNSCASMLWKNVWIWVGIPKKALECSNGIHYESNNFKLDGIIYIPVWQVGNQIQLCDWHERLKIGLVARYSASPMPRSHKFIWNLVLLQHMLDIVRMRYWRDIRLAQASR